MDPNSIPDDWDLESGYYFALITGPKMIRASATNSEWQIVRIENVGDEPLRIGSRTLTEGYWVQIHGSPNWMRLTNYGFIKLVPIEFPEKAQFFKE